MLREEPLHRVDVAIRASRKGGSGDAAGAVVRILLPAGRVALPFRNWQRIRSSRMSLRVISSNSLETLLARFCDTISSFRHDPLEPDWVVTQSLGMDRWLVQGLAARRGVAANLRSLFPLKFLRQAFVWLELGEEHPVYDRRAMTFAVAAAIPALIDTPEFEPLKGYLHEASRDHALGKEARLLSLASRIADVFDGYLLYRHHWFGAEGAWIGSQPEIREAHVARHIPWQRMLFEEVNRIGGGRHRAHLAHESIVRLQEGAVPAGVFPEVLTIFGISYLPKLYLDLFSAISKVSDLFLFVPNPCRQFWSDLGSAKQRARRMLLNPEDPADEPIYNPLLRSLGRQAREYHARLVDVPDVAREDFGDAFVDPVDAHGGPKATLLRQMQSDILNLCFGDSKNGEEGKKHVLEPGDRSLTVHYCHSRLREVEVARDLILAAFDADPALRPSDIVLMSPAVEDYAPFFPGVFGAAPRIPYRVADMPFARDERIANLFFSILDLAFLRFEASVLLDILGHDAVLQKFGLGPQEYESLARAVKESGIRWGWDEADRGGKGSFRANSWEWGIDRLVLGVAMERGERTFEDLRPIAGMDGVGLEPLEGLLAFLAALKEVVDAIRLPHTLRDWASVLAQIFDRLIAESEEAVLPRREILTAAHGLIASAADAASGFSECTIGLAPYRRMIADQLEQGASSAHAFLSGKVTICSLKPMRAIPFKVVILMGLNDGAFPRVDRRPSFDLAAARRELGDRVLSDEERFLFLEALLAARSTLSVTCIALDVRSNKAIPPSIVVSELLEAIEASFRFADVGKNADEQQHLRERLVVRHGLMPFSSCYFRPGGSLTTYSEGAYQAALSRVKGQTRLPAPRFAADDLRFAPGDDANEPLELSDIISFFRAPHRFLCRRYGIVFQEPEGVDDQEPIELDGLERFGLQQSVLERRLEVSLRAKGLLSDAVNAPQVGTESDDLSLALADGALPIGGFAAAVMDGILENAAILLDAVASGLAAWNTTFTRARHMLQFEVGGRRVLGKVSTFESAGLRVLLDCRASRMSAKEYLDGWLTHLALSITTASPTSVETLLIRRAKGNSVETVRFPALLPGEAESIFEKLLGVYESGRAAPIALFPQSALVFAQSGDMGKAIKAFLPGFQGKNDSDDPCVRYCYPGDIDLLLYQPAVAHEFQSVAHTVFDRLLEAISEDVEGDGETTQDTAVSKKRRKKPVGAA